VEIETRSWAIPVLDTSSIGEARRTAGRICAELGASEQHAGEISIVITEAARNVLIHGGGGQVIVSGVLRAPARFVDLLALDSGPGIKDLARAMEDGYSTAGTPGTGLGAIKRLSSILEFYSVPGGTALFSRLNLNGGPPSPLNLSGIAIPLAGEKHCGDAWSFVSHPQRKLILLVDGLGHGDGAADAAAHAVSSFHQNVHCDPAEILSYIHDNLKATRGAVAAIAEIREDEKILNYAGVGNISGVVFSGDSARSLVSLNGTLGSVFPKVKTFQSPWNGDSCLIMHSDGIKSRWDLSPYPGLLKKHPATIAGVLVRDFRRQRDDCSVVVLQNLKTL
jgi:anti-sigma regulatory factor (Ser/Thr protein kinase)